MNTLRLSAMMHPFLNHSLYANVGVCSATTSFVLLTVTAHSPKRPAKSCNCALSSTRGMTHVTSTVPSTWSMLPLINPRLSARMITSSTASAVTSVRPAISSKDSVLSDDGLSNTILTSANSVIFSFTASARPVSAGCAAMSAACSVDTALNAETSPLALASISFMSHSPLVPSRHLRMGFRTTSAKLYTPSPVRAAMDRSVARITLSSASSESSGV
mmetsp:Transcript_20941/g.60972  ORF Transcript_20941/g.60972 Transcript_20941/m.60972 type:complete len:217 (-) Transcript_20941:900-1550(-)